MAAADQVMHRLNKALEEGALPPQGQKIGQRLMTQLHQPTRIAFIGLAGAGKSRMINLLLGADLMPEYPGVNAIEIGYGTEARTQFTMADGTIVQRSGQVAPSQVPPGVARIAMHSTDLRLKGKCITEYCLSSAPGLAVDLIAWMAERTDIAIWCSSQFDERERALWSAAPEHLKDNSFLVLTRADRLFMKGELAGQIDRLQPIVADEFYRLYPVATLQAASARVGGVVNNADLWKSSGGKAVYEGILAQAEQARLADLDHATMLLERFKVPAPDAQIVVKTAAADIKHTAVPAVGTNQEKPPSRRISTRAAPSGKSGDVIHKALGMLRGCADDLMSSNEPANGPATDRILERCNATAQDLVQLLSENDDGSQQLEALREDAFEGEQMLLLLRLERGETAAEDSLTVLLQMKKEMSERLAV